MSDTDSLTTERLALSNISLSFVDRFVRSLRFCYLEFDEEAIAISDVVYRCPPVYYPKTPNIVKIKHSITIIDLLFKFK